jgi:hypothetical protein
MDDPYYGGGHYGEMLKVVTPMLRAALPSARVWLGGLLLATPNSPGNEGYPERFLEGVLLAGAGPYFDVLPYHWYPSYYRYFPCDGCAQERTDYDLTPFSNWSAWGGGSAGKAVFLNSVLSKYQLTKSLSLNETALGCVEQYFIGGCDPSPDEEFLQAQADFIGRASLRAINAGVTYYSWFTLVDEWRYTGLLAEERAIKPVYVSYQNLIRQYGAGIFRGAVYYGSGIESYAIQREQTLVHVLWTVTDEIRTVSFPAGKLLEIYDRDGMSIPVPAPQSDGKIYYNVSYSPTYFHLAP